MWIVEFFSVENGDIDVTIFDTKEDACKYACCEIQDYIESNLDMDDETSCRNAKEVNDLIAGGAYFDAVVCWNNSDINCNYSTHVTWHVYNRNPIVSVGNPQVNNDSYYKFLAKKEEEEDEEDCDEEEDAEIEEEDYQASTPGATCRGPCGSHSPDAYANKRDGTFVCYQCRMMSEVFNGKEIK